MSILGAMCKIDRSGLTRVFKSQLLRDLYPELESEEFRTLSIAQAVYKLNPEQKDAGTTLIGTIFGFGVRESEELWELAQTLSSPV
jgi:hypothetical protein